MIESRKIRNFIVSSTQVRFGIYAFIGIFIGVGLHSLFIIQKVSQQSEIGEIPNGDELISFIRISFIATTMLVGLFIFLLNIVITHRIFGSMLHIENELKKILEGEEIHQMTCRPLDETKSLVAILNKFLDAYKKKSNEGRP